ncbi:MAG: CPBP family intramembrane metalloprotease [Prolixibacteraceae bacterium]|nr:CPBP family intramembrane metalloprotease [Prolixibacteraceae bacterium]
MKNSERIIYGLILTTVIFLAANLIGTKFSPVSGFFPRSFVTHSVMMILSIILIIVMKKTTRYKIAIPKFKTLVKPFLFGIVVAIVVNIVLSFIIIKTGGKNEAHPLLSEMKPMQVLLFVFFYASICEELLFRGFLMNILRPLKRYKLDISGTKLSLPVIISALMFGAAHLILITTGASGLFILRIVLFTFFLGLLSGYHQEKNNNNIHAIIAHMGGNVLSIVSVFMVQ